MRRKWDIHLFYVAQAGLRDPMHKALSRTEPLGALGSGLGVIQQHLPDRRRVQVHMEVS